MEQLSLFEDLPIFRVHLRLDGQAQAYEVEAHNFEEARQIVAREFANQNVWVIAHITDKQSGAHTTHTFTPSPGRA